MSTTLLKQIIQNAMGIHNDGTYLYVGLNSGKIIKITISGAAQADFAILNDEIAALTADATNLYVGMKSGQLKNVVISTGVVSTLEFFPAGVVSLGINSTNLYIGLDNGEIRYKDLS